MSEPIGLLRRARYLYAIGLLQLTASCSAWHPVPAAGLARPEGERLGHIKVFLRDGTVLELENAMIRPDSIIDPGTVTFTRVAIARTEVARVDTRRPDGARTFLLGMLAPVALGFLYVVMIQALDD